jgi:hypothetical protein
MSDFRVQSFTIRELQRYLDEGRFAVPNLQREFVWNGNKAAKLLDSITRGMPIGALLVWQTDRRNQHYLRNHLHILPPFDPRTNREIWFLIDGQQRLSVMYQAHRGDTKENSRGRAVDFSRLVFDVATAASASDRFRYRRAEGAQYFSVPELLGPKWPRLRRALATYKARKLDEVRTAIQRYRVPVVFVNTTNIDEIRELFIRINSQGIVVGAADRAFARATKLDFRAWARDLLHSLPSEFGRLPYEAILQAFAFVADPDVKDVGARSYDMFLRQMERDVKKGRRSKAFVQRQWQHFESAYGKALDYLRIQFCVRGPQFLPSTVMVSMLAVFFAHHRGQPDKQQRRRIRQWFWATAIGQRYTGRGFRRNVLPDIAFFRSLARGRQAHLGGIELVDPIDLERTEYGRATSISAAVYCLLASRKPRYLTNGEPVPESVIAAKANRENKHHVFPRALLTRYGVSSRAANSICNICFVVAEENQSIGSKRPSTYLEEYRRRRFFRSAMRSHLIDSASPGIWTYTNVRRGFKAFVHERRTALCRELNREAGMRLFTVSR